MTVIAPKGCNDYLTAGKEYEVYNVRKSKNFEYFFDIKNDAGSETYCSFKTCPHLKGKDWLTQPTLKQRLLTLTEKYPNDMILGSEVRKLLRDE